jgi:hypothetical protein
LSELQFCDIFFPTNSVMYYGLSLTQAADVVSGKT